MPTALGARLDDVGVEVIGAGVQRAHLLRRGYTPSLGPDAMAEDIGDEAKLNLIADRAHRLGLRAHVACCTNEFGVGITHHLKRDATLSHFTDEHPPSESVVHDSARAVGATANRTN